MRLLWRKRLILGLIIGLLFAFWATSLGVTTDTEQDVNIIGEEGDDISVERSEDDQEEPVASVTLRPGETARMDEDLTLGEQPDTPRMGSPPPERPAGIPFAGLLLLLGPFLAAVYAWRYLSAQTTSSQANYGIYKGALPLEAVTASHATLVRTGRTVETNPFGKARGDYLRDALDDPAREHGPRLGRRDPARGS